MHNMLHIGDNSYPLCSLYCDNETLRATVEGMVYDPAYIGGSGIGMIIKIELPNDSISRFSYIGGSGITNVYAANGKLFSQIEYPVNLIKQEKLQPHENTLFIEYEWPPENNFP